jgi:hypothetical protein
MGNIFKISLALSLMIIYNNIFAKLSEEKFKVFEKNVSFSVPTNWQSINKEVGVPLKLIGPMHDGRRPVVMFVPIDLKEELVLENPKKAEKSYRLSRLKWLQKFNGQSIKFLALKTFDTHHNDIKFHQFSHLYSLSDVNFEEKSYYIRCNKNTYHVKTLIQLEHSGKWGDLVDKIAKSFNCQ